MTNDQLCLFPMLSYGNKNTVGAVARLFFFDPPFKPHATYGGILSVFGGILSVSGGMFLLGEHYHFYIDCVGARFYWG